ncbi:chorismate mutase [Thermomonospora catenispora]|uniref:chorismate mutase n=1 Tax=Thermomonospora catenispora TaxID=2493090 RepID=UPI00111DA6C9|nr:chorismate mutase [Thermomonospora catenispora]TNY34867.1 chorismate mutase [Thermomonospora catenispora]
MTTADAVGGTLAVRPPLAAEAASSERARAAIDEVDAAQRPEPVGGTAGRAPRWERRIVETTARRAPALGVERLSRIMNAVIEAGPETAEEAR